MRKINSLKSKNFSSVLAVYDHLKATGWKVGRSILYDHARQGTIERSEDGTFSDEAVNRYATAFCKRTKTGVKLADTKLSVQEERESVRLEREKVRLQKERRELELIEGKSIPRAEVELMVVGRAVAMLSHLKAMTQMRASDWIHIVDGDQSRAAELIAEIQDGIEEYLATFARDVEFKVILAPAGDAPAAQSDDLDDSDE
jgi:hypothetical protein